MKKNYEKPVAEIVKFEVEDVVTASNEWTQSGDDGKPESGAPDIF